MNRQELERIKSDIQYKIDNHIVNPKNGKYKIAYKFPGEDSSRRITVRGKDSTEIAMNLIDARDKRDLKEEEQKKSAKRFDKIASKWYDSEVARGICDGTNDTNMHIINDILNPEFGLRSIEEITRQEIKNFLMKQGEYYRRDYLKKIKSAIVGIYAYANDAEITNYFPVNNINISKMRCLPPLDDISKNPVTNEEMLQALIASGGDHQMILILSMLFVYGLRPFELINLKWKNVDFDNKTIFVEVSKYTDALNYDPKLYQRYLPISPTILKLLIEEKANSIGEYIFYKRKSHKQLTTETLDKYFNTLTRDREILNGAKVVNNKIVEPTGLRHFVPYAFRRRRITDMQLEPNMSEALIDAFNGHVIKGVNGKNYTRFDYEKHLEPLFVEYLKIPDEELSSLLKQAKEAF